MARVKNVDLKQLDELLDTARGWRDEMEGVMREIECLLRVDIDDLDEKLDYSAIDLVDYVATSIGEENDHDDPEDEDNCTICGDPLDDSGEGWDNLCPGCADRVSGAMDEKQVDREAAIEMVRQDKSEEWI